ncbi:MAG: hypothetical protein H0T74_10600 [Rubrobacteraceae bacterium]|nr:hypothetical protein [Rubrobacteraceae bacterium]
MVDRGKARDVNEAARRFAETLAESYRVVYGQAAESGERQQRLAQEFSELVANNLREQAEGGRSGAQRLSEQADRQQEAGRALAQESVEAYMDFLDASFSQYRAGAMASGRTAAGVVGAATGAVTDATARTMDAATLGAQRTAETATFPIAGYDEMNVEEISERVDALTDEQVRRLRDYERANQNRKTLIERFESRLRASS